MASNHDSTSSDDVREILGVLRTIEVPPPPGVQERPPSRLTRVSAVRAASAAFVVVLSVGAIGMWVASTQGDEQGSPGLTESADTTSAVTSTISVTSARGVQTPSTTTPSVTSKSSAFFERLEIECSFSLRDGVPATLTIEVVPRVGRGDTRTASVGPFAVQVVVQHLPDLPTNLWVGVFEGSGEPTEPLYSDTADLPDEPEPGVDLLAFHVESDDGSDALTGACRSQ